MSGGGRRLIHWLAVAVLAASPSGHARAAGSPPPLLQRFLALDDPPAVSYRALRHLDARNDHFESSAWMDVWTDADRQHGFRYEILSAGGSEYIRSRVFLATLETERRMWTSGEPERAALTPDNYVFEDRGRSLDGLAGLDVRPRRKDVLLFEGSIFLRPDDADLVRIEGRLSKTPSFWTRKVEIVRWYRRVAGVRMPVALETVANLLVAGRSTFTMTYDYESVNGQRIGSPHARVG